MLIVYHPAAFAEFARGQQTVGKRAEPDGDVRLYWLGGRYADRSVDRTLIVTLALLALILVAFAVPMPFTVLGFLWGVASFALVPPLQADVVVESRMAHASRLGPYAARTAPSC